MYLTNFLNKKRDEYDKVKIVTDRLGFWLKEED